MADILIKRVDDDEWRAPGSRTVADEAELQQILATSPNLLPGPDDIPLVAVQEFPLSSGRVDIVAVAADETIVLEIVALELSYVRDSDVEMMIPVVYGEEAVVFQAARTRDMLERGRAWEYGEVESSSVALAAIQELHQWSVDHEVSYFWGEGERHPSMTAWIPINGDEAPVWTCYPDDDGATVLGLNFEWLTNRVSQDSLKQLTDDLRLIPEAASVLIGIEDNGYKRRPSVAIEGVLTRSEAMANFLAAYATVLKR